MKVDKFIALSGYTSRRKACDLITDKQVTVNGKTANFTMVVKEGDRVEVNGTLIKAQNPDWVVLAYHKPRGIVCTTEKIPGNIIDAVAYPQTIYPVGRLDKESEGLILLTNKGEMIDKISNSANQHEKEYLVTLNLPVRTQFLKDIRAGIQILGEQTKPCQAVVEKGTKRVMRIILTQGLNRQIRRMCNAYDYQVLKLQRVRVMSVTLGSLQPGQWRELSPEELDLLKKQTDTQATATE